MRQSAGIFNKNKNNAGEENLWGHNFESSFEYNNP